MTDTINAASRELVLEPGGSVDINVSVNQLRIRGTDGDRVVVRTADGSSLADDVRIDAGDGVIRIRDGGVGLQLGPLHLRTGRSPDLDIDLPATAALSVRTLSGDVVATGLGAASRWATASGDLRISTSAGPVQVETMSGDAVIDASVAITLGARTVSGDLRVHAPGLEVIDASSTSGDIRVEATLAAGARHVISSVSGDVEVATGSPVRLEAQTIAGDIRASGPHRAEGGRGRRTLVVGNGSVALSVRTTSGDVQLRVLGAPLPGAPKPPVAPVPPVAPAAPVAPTAPVPPVAPNAPVPPGVTDPSAGFDTSGFDLSGFDLSGFDTTGIDATAIELPGPGVAAVAPAPAPRPITDEDTQAWAAPESVVDRREAARLDVLRALERGDLDIETASRRLEALEDAGPRAFRGWC